MKRSTVLFSLHILFMLFEHSNALLNPSSTTHTALSPFSSPSSSKHRHPRNRHSEIALNMVGGSILAPSYAIALPKLSTIIGTTVTPTLLGFYKVEYGVSYAYGTATAATAAIVLRSILSINSSSMTTSPFLELAKLHAAALIFYGIRLNIFLLYREIFLKRFRKMREQIEERRAKKTNGGLSGRIMSRMPFVLGCSFLYAGLAYPTILSAQMVPSIIASTASTTAASSSATLLTMYKTLVYGTWFGFILGAIGDLNKSIMKSIKGEDHLVTGGIYRFFRHPNYTGEIIGWSASFFASIVAIVAGWNKDVFSWNHLIGPVMTSTLGWIGILFVLLGATRGLEKKQYEKYSGRKEYKEWVKKSWKGFAFEEKK